MSLAKYKPVKVVKSRDLHTEKVLKKNIGEASKAIRKKYLALKMGRAEEYETVNRLLNPIIEPLKELNAKVSKRKEQAVQVKQEEEEQPSTSSPPIKRKRKKTPVEFLEDQIVGEVFSPEEGNREGEHESTTIEDVQEAYDNLLKYNKPVLDEFLEQFPDLSRYYIEGFFVNRDDYDENFGARFDFRTNKLHVGNKELHISPNNELILDNRPYEGTKGLYDLVFLKKTARLHR